eukprot:TRINITY_DN15793_c0_g1_i1.p1 TRINITY_DN15793_c0_g1~~TRINITY_DN15793_c0_g1_i1.p1  ORF type:complete len:702 (-),score=198.71 TRINITY_DN15793_c0_g1_i1:430-2535(-)
MDRHHDSAGWKAGGDRRGDRGGKKGDGRGSVSGKGGREKGAERRDGGGNSGWKDGAGGGRRGGEKGHDYDSSGGTGGGAGGRHHQQHHDFHGAVGAGGWKERRGGQKDEFAHDYHANDKGESCSGNAGQAAGDSSIKRYTRDELLNIARLPASKLKPDPFDETIDKDNLESTLLLRIKSERNDKRRDGDEDDDDGRREQRHKDRQEGRPEREDRRADRHDLEEDGRVGKAKSVAAHRKDQPSGVAADQSGWEAPSVSDVLMGRLVGPGANKTAAGRNAAMPDGMPEAKAGTVSNQAGLDILSMLGRADSDGSASSPPSAAAPPPQPVRGEVAAAAVAASTAACPSPGAASEGKLSVAELFQLAHGKELPPTPAATSAGAVGRAANHTEDSSEALRAQYMALLGQPSALADAAALQPPPAAGYLGMPYGIATNPLLARGQAQAQAVAHAQAHAQAQAQAQAQVAQAAAAASLLRGRDHAAALTLQDAYAQAVLGMGKGGLPPASASAAALMARSQAAASAAGQKGGSSVMAAAAAAQAVQAAAAAQWASSMAHAGYPYGAGGLGDAYNAQAAAAAAAAVYGGYSDYSALAAAQVAAAQQQQAAAASVAAAAAAQPADLRGLYVGLQPLEVEPAPAAPPFPAEKPGPPAAPSRLPGPAHPAKAELPTTASAAGAAGLPTAAGPGTRPPDSPVGEDEDAGCAQS